MSRLLPPFLLILAGVLAYWNSFDGVFLYDDLPSIRDNPHIRVLWPLSRAMSVPLWDSGVTVDGRPVLSLTFALNHALFGPEPWGHHLVNLVIHIAAGLLLFGIVRRTLALPRYRERYAGSLSKNQSDTAAQAARGDARPPVLKHSRKFGGRASSRAGIPGQSTGGGTWVALIVALIWLVHPLQTESVTYIVQRAESLMGFFFLLTLYCAIRGFRAQPARGDARPPQKNQARGVTTGGRASPRAECGAEKRTPNTKYRISNIWYLIALLACACGMGVKQTMFSAPLLVLLYDYVFIRGPYVARSRLPSVASEARRTGRERGRGGAETKGWALAGRPWFYISLFSTWLIVLGIIALTWQESTSDFARIGAVRYALTQPLVILYYLRLSAWPDPLVLNYGWVLEDQWPRIVFPGLVVLGMLGVMFRGIWRRRWYGFVLAWFFLILAPTSSIAPMRQALFEHRMYLSLAAVVIAAVVGSRHVIHRVTESPSHRVMLLACLTVIVVVVLGIRTHARNRHYHSELVMWRDNLVHRPRSHLAHLNLGNALQASGRIREAMSHHEQALRIKPDYALAHNNLGNALFTLGRTREAIPRYRDALRIDPGMADAHYNLGLALQAVGQPGEAIGHFEQALQLRPDYAEAHNDAANALLALGRPREALARYQRALQVRPDYADAHNNLGSALLRLGQARDAIPHFREALRLKPGSPATHYNLGLALQSLGRLPEATAHYEQAARLDPGLAAAHHKLREAREIQANGEPAQSALRNEAGRRGTGNAAESPNIEH